MTMTADLFAELVTIETALAIAREQNAAYREDQARMQEIVIDLSDGRSMTLWDAYELWDKDKTQFRTLCHCRNVECDGCPINDCADIEIWETTR